MNETSHNLRKTIDTFIETAQFDALNDTCKIALAEARERRDKFTEIIAIVGLSQGHRFIGKFKEARVLINGALDFANQIGDRELLIMALITSAEISLSTTFQVHEAERDYRQALELAKSIGDERVIARVQAGMASVFIQAEDAGRAQKYARDAFETARDCSDRYVMGLSLALIGSSVSNSQPEKAMQAFEDAMAIAQQDNFRLMELGLTGSIGQLLSREERYADEGQLMLEKALAMAKDFRSVPHEFTAIYRLGRALERNQALDRAAQYYGMMLERAQEWRARSYEGVSFFNLGILAYNRTHYDDAIANFEQALVIARETNNPFQEAQAEQVIASSYVNLGNLDEALGHYMSARSIYDSLDNGYMSNIMLQRIVMLYIQRFFNRVLRWIGLGKEDDGQDTTAED